MANSRLEEIRSARLDKLARLRQLGINPYPAKFSKPHIPISDARGKHENVSVVGRLWRWREHGNVIFADLRDSSGQIQLLFQKKMLNDKWQLLNLLDVGDFLGVTGNVTTTQAGEITVDVSFFELLSKSIRPLPDEWYGLKEIEERYRKRYLDLLLSPEVKNRFQIRSRLITQTRKYLDDLGYLEVETPTLQSLYGGANAKPFKTHLNVLDLDMYLRIADELYLKRLVVGGFEKVYEICKDFRNEGMDQTHQPEFTMIEYYEAYADYHRVMDVTEGLFKHLAKHVLNSDTIEVGDLKIDIGKKWRRVTMTELIKELIGLDVLSATPEEIIEFCRKNKIKFAEKRIHYFNLLEADEVFLTNSIMEIMPVKKVDRYAIGYGAVPGPLTAKIHRSYRLLI